MSIRVLHIIGGGEIGGAEQNVLNLLQGFDRNMVEPALACLVKDSPFASLARSKGIETYIFPTNFPQGITALASLVSCCRKNKIELLHCHGIRSNLLGRIAAKCLSIPCISTIHSRLENDYPTAWKSSLAALLEKMTLPWASGLITVSNDLRKSVVARIDRKDSSLPIKTIYNGCAVLDFSNWEELRTDFRQKMGVSDDCIVIGTIGRLHPVKGQIYLVEALQLLAKEFPDLHLLIIGEGPLRSQLKGLLNESLPDHTMTGFLPSAWRNLPAMDLFVLPSLSEGMGLVLLEAAQAGVPIIASRVGGIPELFTDNYEALLVDPADPLELALACSRILRDKNLSKNLVENASEKARNFTIEKMVAETTSFYQDII